MGRVAPGLPKISDGQQLFVLNGLSKLVPSGKMAIIQNGSPLFSGDAGSGPSEIRRYILENDWLDAIVQLGTDMFMNTGISTYIWICSKDKPIHRAGKVQLIDASHCFEARRKSIGTKRNDITDKCRDLIVKAYGAFENGTIYGEKDGIYCQSKIFDTVWMLCLGRNNMSREMKDSGIEWIGEIPEDWKISQIGQMYVERREKVSDKDFIPLSVTMNGILLQLSSAAKTEAHDDRKLVKQGDFVINSRSDRRGSCGISKYNGSVSLINIVLRPNENIESSYYDWLFHSTVFSNEFYKWGHGIVDDLWTTKWQDMKKISVPVPTMSEQKKIADYLCMKCEMIENV